MNKLIVFALILLGTFSKQNSNKPMQDVLLTNHTGYQEAGFKKVVLQTQLEIVPDYFNIIDKNGKSVFKGRFNKGGKIDNWHTGYAYTGNFTEFKQHGEYQIITKLGNQLVKSRIFSISNSSFAQKSLSLLIEGFESQHVSGEYNKKDKKMSFFGTRNDIVDVSGGWYDASGDKAKYFSHLCYSNYLNPQQTPLFVWNLLQSTELYTKKLKKSNKEIKTRLINEAKYGADFLLKMQDREGYYYLTIFANWSGDPEKREICAYEGQDGKRTDAYKAGFREGAGIAIAALARASKAINSGNYKPLEYLESAEKGFAHLLQYNVKYIDDGVENIIDDYCALLAATELFAVTNKEEYLAHARTRMLNLTNRLSADENYKDWWRADDKGYRPFFHGADAGLPLIALSRYLEFETEVNSRNMAIRAIQKSVDFELKITREVYNPFGYPRQYIKAVNENQNRSTFFIPHQNETGYWWQGENSRLASLTAAFYLTRIYMTDKQRPMALEYASNNFDWIFGLNPYDVCMVDGLGYNNPEYIEPVNLNFRGGVCNGITAGFSDESDIAFMPLPQNDDPAQRWRWSEQWMPHAAWLMLAVTAAE